MSLAIALREKKEKESKEQPNQAEPISTPKPIPRYKCWKRRLPVQGEFNPDIWLQVEKDKDYDPQANCPLFKTLPAEVRQNIYKLVFLQYELLSRPYSKYQPYYRPGSTAQKCVDTALLHTCLRVFLEARTIPLKTATHEFWCDTPSPQHTELKGFQRDAIASGLREWHVPHIRHIHVNISALNFLLRTTRPNQTWGDLHSDGVAYNPKTLTVTIGYTDWALWQWGQEPQLKYLAFFLNCPMFYGLQEFTLRLETLEIFKEDLDDIVEVLVQKKLQLSPDPNYPWRLTTDGIPLKVTHWTGPHCHYLARGWTEDIEHLGPEPEEVTEMWYYIVEIKWRKSHVDRT